MPLTGDVAIRHRAGYVRLIRCYRRVGKGGRQHQQALHPLRAAQRHADMQEGTTRDAAVGACEQGQQRRKALPLLRAMRSHTIVPKATTCNAASSASEHGDEHHKPDGTADGYH